MASIYKEHNRKPIPAGAKILERKGRRVATWIDPKTGFKQSAPLSDDGKAILQEAKWYTIAYFDHTGKRRSVGSKTSDHDAAKRLAAKLETEAMERGRGLIDPKAERFALENRRPLMEHVNGVERKQPDGKTERVFVGFRHGLIDKGDTQDHVDQTTMHVRLIVTACKAEHISDLAPSAVQAAIAEQRPDEGHSRSGPAFDADVDHALLARPATRPRGGARRAAGPDAHDNRAKRDASDGNRQRMRANTRRG